MIRIVSLGLALMGVEPAAASSRSDATQSIAPISRPIDFRMDQLETHARDHRIAGQGHVVLRQIFESAEVAAGDTSFPPSTWLLCCDALTGQADASWAWQTLICRGRVRAVRGDETAMADRAQFDPVAQRLVLTGNPRLRRGDSLLAGDRIEMDLTGQALRIVRPRGALAPQGRKQTASPGAETVSGVARATASSAAPIALPFWATGPVPDSCPVTWER